MRFQNHLNYFKNEKSKEFGVVLLRDGGGPLRKILVNGNVLCRPLVPPATMQSHWLQVTQAPSHVSVRRVSFNVKKTVT